MMVPFGSKFSRGTVGPGSSPIIDSVFTPNYCFNFFFTPFALIKIINNINYQRMY